MNKMNINSTINEIMHDEIKNIIYMQIYRLYDNKKVERIRLINSNSQKIEKKTKFFKFNEKQFYFIYNNQISYYSYITNNDLYISSFINFAKSK